MRKQILKVVTGAMTRAAYAAVNRLKPVRKGQRKFFTDLEEETEDSFDSVYAFFVFTEI